jgi:hypothetical protein
MRVIVVEWLCQVVKGQIRGPVVRRAWAPVVISCLALNDLTARGSWLLGHSPDTGNPQAWLPGPRARVELGHKGEFRSAWQVAKSSPFTTIEGGQKGIGADRAQV